MLLRPCLAALSTKMSCSFYGLTHSPEDLNLFVAHALGFEIGEVARVVHSVIAAFAPEAPASHATRIIAHTMDPLPHFIQP